MTIKVKIFGPLAEITGKSELNLAETGDTDSLRIKMTNDFPELANYPFIIAVNKKHLNGNLILKHGDVVAFLPPFSGG